MSTHEFWQLSAVSDDHLLQNLNGLLAAGARSEARIVAHLAEVEKRRLHLKAATSSLFAYCLHRIGLSESEAFHRILAARLARKFPLIFGLLETRAIHLSALRVLRDHLTSDNHRELLAAASGRSTKEVELLVAALAPRPDVAARLRKLPTPRGRALSSPTVASPAAVGALDTPVNASLPVLAPAAAPVAATAGLPSFAPAAALMPAASAPVAPLTVAAKQTRVLEPLSSTRYLLRLSIGQEVKEKLTRARDLMSHANPSGELTLVFEKALDLLLEKLEKQRFAQTKTPRRAANVQLERPVRQAEGVGVAESSESVGTADNVGSSATTVDAAPELARRGQRRKHVPNEIRRAVALRDGCQCTYVDDAGRRCECRTFLQLHHEHAHALGGPSTFENLRLLCGSHNRLLAEQDFGRAHQERFARRRRPTALNPSCT